MPDSNRFSDASAWDELDFVKREATSGRVLEVGVQLDLDSISLSYTV